MVNIYFITEKGKEEKCYSKESFRKAFNDIYNFALKDEKAKSCGYATIKVYWDKYSYKLYQVEYQNGKVRNIS